MNSVRFGGQFIFPKVFTEKGNDFGKEFKPPESWELKDWDARPDKFHYVDVSIKDEDGNVEDDMATDIATAAAFMVKDQNIPFAYKPSTQKSFMASADNPVSEESKLLPLVQKQNPFSWIPKEHR